MTVLWWTTTFFVGGAIGLGVGWIFLPMPGAVRRFLERIHVLKPVAPTV